MSLLTPELGLLFWMLLSFLIVFGVLAKFGFPVITGMVDRRRERIEEGLAAAKEATERLRGVEQEAAQIIGEAQKRQSEIVAGAVADGNRIVENARQKAEAEAAAKLEAALSQIEIEKQKALGELRSEVAMLSVDVAEKVLRQKMTSAETQHDYIDRLIGEAEQNSSKPNA
ncbi:MAG: F0F1 ATP synthase subunit B [Tidjanibacter sp.]|nr:F0F1 ATP synthase subunit B [Tidjanibacter sp.]MBR2423831.1 F0F1 ATP synthase subunit B [Tidjanibacter sp.]MBR3681835.1 F0F1 ATP synthase subunit B [Tidjanibacter sp.]MBR3853586.1 F0F1 ATP synthase subunit B [Tidjanibacter sp.]MBR7130112.1 F0F1 ATP synthase subunit B [Tidjanibacter sp.]